MNRRQRKRRSNLRFRYGIDLPDLDTLLQLQANACAICRTPFRDMPRVDHDASGVRGLLCNTCNTGLGKLGDSVEGLERAIAYLKSPPGRVILEKANTGLDGNSDERYKSDNRARRPNKGVHT